MRVGFAEVRTDDCCDFEMGGTFTNYLASSCKFHSPLYASAFAVEAGENSFIWVSCDLARFAESDADLIREEISQKTGVPFDHVLVSATHAHAGPTARPSISPYFEHGDLSYFAKFGARIAEAGVTAWNNLGDAYLSYAHTKEAKCVHNRRYIMETGESMMEPGGPEFPGRLMKEGPEDTELQVLWFMPTKDYDYNKIDRPLAVIVNYQSHASEVYGEKWVSAGFPGVIRRNIQAVYGNIPVIYLQGCCGNLTPRDHEHDNTWGHYIDGTERIGTILAADVMRLIALQRDREDVGDIRITTEKCRVNLRAISDEDRKKSDEVFAILAKDRAAFDALDVKEKAFANKIKNLQKKWDAAPCEDIPVTGIRLGDVVLLTHPAELFCEYQLDIKKRLGPKTMIVELTNGGICYIGTKQAYLHKGYEINAGFYDYYAGETIENHLLKLAKEVGRDEVPQHFSEADE